MSVPQELAKPKKHSPFEAQGKQEWLCQEDQEDPESWQDAGATKVGMVRTLGAVLRPYEARWLIANR